MNPRTNQLSHSCKALACAGLARAGALLALALGAAQAGATTYNVPLQFNITLAAPVCSLTVGGVTADATTPVQASGPVVDLTPTPLPAISSPNAVVGTGLAHLTVPITAEGPGLAFNGTYNQERRLSSPPPVEAVCTVGTPMTARLTKASSARPDSQAGIHTTAFMAGAPGAQQEGTLPIGMLMGIASFGGVAGVTGFQGTADTGTHPVAITATGSPQTLALTAAFYANNSLPMNSNRAGLWTYRFNVHLDF